jgi:hypothetical protein
MDKSKVEIAFEVGVLLRWLMIHKREGKGKIWWSDARDHVLKLAELLEVDHPCIPLLKETEK